MKTRPHIVTQTRLYPVAGFCRNADLLSRRMGDVKKLSDLLGYSRVLIRIMKIIMDLTVRNNCFEARRQALSTPQSRRHVLERLGGAHALLRWRRMETWNKGRLAAIAAGTYRPAPEPDMPAPAKRLAGPQIRISLNLLAVSSPAQRARLKTPTLRSSACLCCKICAIFPGHAKA